MAEMAKWRRHTVEFKRQVVERMKTCENIGALARELDLERKLLYTWKYQFEGRPELRHANLATTPEERKDKQLRDNQRCCGTAHQECEQTVEVMQEQHECEQDRSKRGAADDLAKDDATEDAHGLLRDL